MSEIEAIDIKDKKYPPQLKDIKDPPKTLYFRGNIPKQGIYFAIVGTRLASFYGKKVASEIAGDLAESGFVIVSGLAPGIDTVSHKAAIERGGKTIAVLGTGLDEKSVYPKDNIGLARKISEGQGCLISEYPPGTQGGKFTFPQRNRIISGLSVGVLVVEAKEKSGSLITANWAKKQGKKIFAVPGSIHSSNSKGCHYLIKHGAILVENFQDILNELKLPSLKTKKKKEIKGENNEENLILEALKEDVLDVDKIVKRTHLPVQRVIANLSILEIKNKIKNLGGNHYTISS